MHFEGEFSVPGNPPDVIQRFADVERMSRCMPGAVIEGRDDEGNYLGGMLVSFGPKKIKFKGRVSAETDPAALTGSIRGRGGRSSPRPPCSACGDWSSNKAGKTRASVGSRSPAPR